MLGRRNMSEWISQLFDTISMDSVRNVFRHIEFSTYELSPFQKLYPVTPFLYLHKTDCDSVNSKSVVGFE